MRLYSYKPRIGAPDVPRNVTITSVTDTTITISWTANTESDFSSYNLYRSTNGTTYGLPYVSGLTSNSYQDTGLTASTLYYYKVTCEDTSGNESGFSSAVSQETIAPPAGLSWSQDLPNPIEFTYGVEDTFDLDPYISGTPGSITVETGALPPNVTIVGQTLSYDGGGSSFGHTETNVSFRLNNQLITAITINSTVGGDVPWTFGQAFKQGDIPSGNYISTSLSQSQAHIRNRWSDGSVKYAVISGRGDGICTIYSTSTAPSGTNIAEKTPAYLFSNISVTLTGDGAGTYTPSTAATNGITTWNKNVARKVREFLGPVMSEFHYYQPCTAPYATTPDDHLAIWWYVRVYSDRTEVETVIENGWSKVASPTAKSYTAVVSIGGSTVFNSGALTHRRQTRWSRVDWIGGDPGITPQHNVAYLRSTKLVPNYGFNNPTSTVFSTTTLNPAPFTQGDWPSDMEGTGGSSHIALLPTWDAQYFNSGSSNAYVAALGNTRRAGMYYIHYRDETTGRPIDWRSYNTSWTDPYGTNHPFLILSGSSSYTDGSIRPMASNDAIPTGSGNFRKFDAPHHPSNGYASYLISGRWTFLEEAQFTAIYCMMREGYKSQPTTSRGLVEPCGSVHSLRGAAWTWRSLGQVAAISPTQISGETDIQASIAAALDVTTTFLKAKYIDGSVNSGTYANTIGWLSDYTGDGQAESDGRFWWRSFMIRFQCIALAHISDLGIENINQTTLEAVRNHAYDGALQYMGTDASTWPWQMASMYDIPYGSTTSPSPPYLSVPAQYDAYCSFFGVPQSVPGGLSNTMLDAATQTALSSDLGYAVYMMVIAAMAADHGRSGASTAYSRYAGATNYGLTSAYNNDPRWGIVPR